ncbi:MAG: prolipoprotein diacylglyceryl transferase family protein [Leptospirales bacterium]
MYPILYEFEFLSKKLAIGSYGLIAIVASVTAILISVYFIPHKKLSKSDIFDMSMLVFSLGLLGAMVMHFILFPPRSWDLSNYPSGLISYGGLLGGIPAFYIIRHKWNLNFEKFADLFTIPFVFGLAIGRIGCFFGGCCFGKPTDSAIGVFINTNGIHGHVIPTNLISSIFLFALGAFLIYLSKKKKEILVPAFFIIYALFRFTIEFWRDDPRQFFLTLSDGQWYAIISLMVGLYLLATKKNIFKKPALAN